MYNAGEPQAKWAQNQMWPILTYCQFANFKVRMKLQAQV